MGVKQKYIGKGVDDVAKLMLDPQNIENAKYARELLGISEVSGPKSAPLTITLILMPKCNPYLNLNAKVQPLT